MKTLFTRANYYRKPQYLVRTSILEDANKIIVRNESITEDSREQINSIKRNYDEIRLKYPFIKTPKVYASDLNKIDFEYIKLPVLQDLIAECLIKKEDERVLEIFKDLDLYVAKMGIIKSNPTEESEFLKIFDPENRYKNIGEERSIKDFIYDFNIDNLLSDVKNSTYYLVDFEWFFNFSIPLRFFQFRILYYFSSKLKSIIRRRLSEKFPCYRIEAFDLLIPKALFEYYNFTEEEFTRFVFYEMNFQNMVNFIQRKVEVEKGVTFELITKPIKGYIDSLEYELVELKELRAKDQNEMNQLRSDLDADRIRIQILENDLNRLRSSKLFRIYNKMKKVRRILLSK